MTLYDRYKAKADAAIKNGIAVEVIIKELLAEKDRVVNDRRLANHPELHVRAEARALRLGVSNAIDLLIKNLNPEGDLTHA